MRIRRATSFGLAVRSSFTESEVDGVRDDLTSAQPQEYARRIELRTWTSLLRTTGTRTRVEPLRAGTQRAAALLVFLIGGVGREAQTPPTIAYDNNPRSQVVLSNAAVSLVVQPPGSPPLCYGP